MPKSLNPPKYRLHRASGLATVVIRRKTLYLGKYGSPESWTRYAKVLADAEIHQVASGPEADPTTTVNMLRRLPPETQAPSPDA
jgi:hypothetical protein